MENSKGWILVIGILLIVSLTALGIVYSIYISVRNTVQPVQSMTGELGTQVAMALHPTPTVLVDPVTIVRDVRTLARLETIQYSVEKVITAQSGQETFGALFGDKLIFVAHGQVIAGVDLSKMGPDDLWINQGVVYVRMPPPEIFIATLDNEKSYVYDRETGLFTKGDVNLETTARRAAENEIEKAAVEDGILNLARQNAEFYLSRLLDDLGHPDVIFVYDSPTPTP
jgi:hypothetical protein